MSDNTILADRAASYLKQLLDVAIGPSGMFYSYTRFDTRKPFQAGEDYGQFFTNALDLCWGDFTPRPLPSEWWANEDTLWVTGWLLRSQMLRYAVTREAEALAVARKCFRDLNYIFRISRALEPGLLAKPHGGRAGWTTSFDQSGNPVLWYVAFAKEHATPAEKAEAVENMTLHGEWYFRRNWIVNHHGNLSKIVDPCHSSTMKYLACVYAAYELTGEMRFRDAAVKYLKQIADAGMLPWPSNPYSMNFNLFYYPVLIDYWMQNGVEIGVDWKRCIGEYWAAAQKGLDGEGLLRSGTYETVRREFTPDPDGWIEIERWHLGRMNKVRTWRSATCYAARPRWSVAAAGAGLIARSHGLDSTAHEKAKRTLLRLDDNCLREWMLDEKLPEPIRPLTNMFDGGVTALWLVVYWMGRAQGAW